MTGADERSDDPRPAEGSRGLALWVVLAAVVAATIAVLDSARTTVAILVFTLVAVAVIRGRLRSRSPEGMAIRSVGVDLATLTLAAAALTVLAATPGV